MVSSPPPFGFMWHLMLLNAQHLEGIAGGKIKVTFRKWKKPTSQNWRAAVHSHRRARY